MNVLLIEDNPGDTRLIQEMLRQRPYQDPITLKIATTLSEGVAAGRALRYDAILLDLSLPDSLGIDTLHQARAMMPDTAIVVLTGMDDQQIGVQAVQMGAQDYLPKGDVDGKLLLRALRYAIERHRSESALRRSEQEYRSLIDDVFDTSMVGVIILDSDLKVVWCNEATEIYFSLQREDIIGQDKRHLIDQKLKCIFENSDEYSNRLLKAYEQADFSDRFECHVMPDTNREERWLEHWSQPIRSGMYQGGRIEQYMDITDRKYLELAEQEQRHFAEALRDTIALLTSTLDLNDVLGRILTNLDRVVPHDSAMISIYDDGGDFWVAQRDSRTPNDAIILKRPAETTHPFLYKLQEDAHVILDEYDAPTDLGGENSRAYMGAPIRLQQTIIGFINVFSAQPDFFKAKDAERLSVFGEQAAIAIQNARLYQQSLELAALEERQRLARDLHDSVSQTLFTCRAMSETALRRWDRDPARAFELLGEVHQLTVTALGEMRVLLLELRPTTLTQVGLKELFEQYLQPIQERRQFAIKLTINDLPPLPPDVQIALYRIAQEALNNIDKHANATHVEISVVMSDSILEMKIHDNGNGFDPDEINKTSFGLNIMQERAQAIQATIKINSQQGTGTCIHVHWASPIIK